MKHKGFAIVAAALLATSSFPALASVGDQGPMDLVNKGKFFGQVRYRYEFVDQDGISNDADASTVRTNLGFKTGVYKGFQALMEAQIVQNIGPNDFNDTTNGQTSFPVVADPDVAEINELWASYSGLPDTSIKVGRQKINIDNQRFVGTVGWRQNDQTFDAVTVTNTSIDGLDLSYSYVGNVNRIQGDDHPLGDLDSSVHLARAAYKFADWLKVAAYGYWLDFDESAANSNKTYGVRLTGKVPLSDDWTFFYEAEGATQDDHGNNTANYDENYYHVAPGIKGHGLTIKGGYEELGGDGTNSFRTPLATGHKFNGWADKFLTTPAAGLEDTYIMGAYKLSGIHKYVDGTVFKAFYHDFEGDSSGDFGSEFDFVVGKTFDLKDYHPFDSINFTLKYADYEADDAPYTDTQKFWFQVDLKF